MKILLIMLLLCGTCYAEWVHCPVCDCDYKKGEDEAQHGKGKWCDKKETLHFKDSLDTSYVASISEPPCSAISIRSPSGKQVDIDFSGDVVVYKGDLPVAESARIFFDAVFAIYKKEIKPAGGKGE